MRARPAAVVGVVCLTALALPGADAAPAGVDIGATPQSGVTACMAGTLAFQDTVGANQSSWTTTAGVITSWEIRQAAAPDDGPVALKVGRLGAPGTVTITGSSILEHPAAGSLDSFLTRIPVTAGDVLGLWVPPGQNGGCLWQSGAGNTIEYVTSASDPTVGTVKTGLGSSPYLMDVAARIEPDADGDGYGDLTQDACPTLANSHDDCTPPDTFLKGAPPKKVTARGKTAKVKIAFVASEPATFTCRLDKQTAKRCSGSFKAKAGPGKHTLSVTATDTVGNVDPTPLTVRFRVVHRR